MTGYYQSFRSCTGRTIPAGVDQLSDRGAKLGLVLEKLMRRLSNQSARRDDNRSEITLACVRVAG